MNVHCTQTYTFICIYNQSTIYAPIGLHIFEVIHTGSDERHSNPTLTLYTIHTLAASLATPCESIDE